MKKGNYLRTLRFIFTTVILFVLSFSAVVITILNVYVPQYVAKIDGEEVAYFESPSEFDEVYETLVDETKADGLEVEVYLKDTPTYELTYVRSSVLDEQNQYTNLRAFLCKEYTVYNVAVKGNTEMTFASREEAEEYAEKLESVIKSSVRVEVVEQKADDIIDITDTETAKNTYDTLVSRYKTVVRTYTYSYSGMVYNYAMTSGETYDLISGGTFPTVPYSSVCTQRFGNTSFSTGHQGIDIASLGYANVDIYSYKAGVVDIVELSPYNSSYGCYVRVYHGTSSEGVAFYTLYSHFQYGTICVKEGDIVEEGQKLGNMGTTGHSTGVHLHFEMRTYKDNILTLQNPYLYVPELYKYIY